MLEELTSIIFNLRMIPGASRTARDYHCPLPRSKPMVGSKLFRVSLLTVMSLAGGISTRPRGQAELISGQQLCLKKLRLESNRSLRQTDNG